MTDEMNIPQAEKLEQAVIGALLLEPGYLPEVVTVLTPDSFFNPFNAKVYDIIRTMYDSGEQIDLFTVSQRCRRDKKLSGENVVPVLADYTTLVGSGAGVVAHARIVYEKHLSRQMISVATKVLGEIQGNGDIVEIIDEFNAGMDRISMAITGGRGAQHIGEWLKASLRDAERRQTLAQSGCTPGVPTGLARLDELTTGWHGGELIVLAARPSVGKTAFMLHSARAAAQAGYAPCIYSLEMSGTSIADRLLLSECNVDPEVYRSGRMDTDDWKEVERATGLLGKLPIYIDDKPVVSMRYIRSHAKVMKKRDKCGIIFIDYLQLADTATDQRNRNREQEVAQASRQAKIIAKELDVPVVLLSQLSRKCDDRSGVNKMPMLSDLRESGAIEQDADVVAFLFRPAIHNIEYWPTSQGEVSTRGFGIINIAKQRNGPTEEVAFRHNHSLTRITDYKLYDNVPKQDTPF